MLEAQPLLHLAENHVGCRVQDSVKALQVDGRKLIEEREYRHAVHHRGFKQEALALFRGQIAEFTVAVHDRAFISRDGVGSMFECGVDVVDGPLDCLTVRLLREIADEATGAR